MRGPARASRSTSAATGWPRRSPRSRSCRVARTGRSPRADGPPLMRIGILTVSDLGAMGRRPDTSGDTIQEWAGARGYEVVVRSVVPDETDGIAAKLTRWAD